MALQQPGVPADRLGRVNQVWSVTALVLDLTLPLVVAVSFITLWRQGMVVPFGPPLAVSIAAVLSAQAGLRRHDRSPLQPTHGRTLARTAAIVAWTLPFLIILMLVIALAGYSSSSTG